MPRTRQVEKVWLDRSKGYAKACAKNGALLEQRQVTGVAKDVDSVRKALGQEQINYGFSYGMYLVQVYGTLFTEVFRVTGLHAV